MAIQTCDPGYQLDNTGKCVPIGVSSNLPIYTTFGVLILAFIIAWWLGK